VAEPDSAALPAYLALPDGTVWPNPLDPGDAQWQMRYAGSPGTSACLVAASTLAAYRELIWMPERRRREVIKALREQAGASS
jgi:hypothetical protein